jgi:hypothetical protein
MAPGMNAVNDAWEREPTTGRHFAVRERELPAGGKDRVVFCTCYGDKFDGDNHEEALSYAHFSVFYLKGMGLPPYGEGER